MLSKKYYKMIAQVVSDNTHTIDNRTHINKMGLVNDLSDVFQEDNINFDKRKFVIACID